MNDCAPIRVSEIRAAHAGIARSLADNIPVSTTSQFIVSTTRPPFRGGRGDFAALRYPLLNSRYSTVRAVNSNAKTSFPSWFK